MTKQKTQDIETKRLYLQSSSKKDEPYLEIILSNKKVNQYLLFENDFKEETLKTNQNSNFSWIIKLNQSQEIIGEIKISNLLEKEKTLEINCFLELLHWDKGYASEALEEVLKYLFLKVSLEKVIAKVAVENKKAILLLEKLGFIIEKTEDKAYPYLNKILLTNKYILTKGRFLKEEFRKESLLITIDIDKEPYMKHFTLNQVLNVTGESGSGKTTFIEENFSGIKSDCIIIDTDMIFGNHKKDNYNQEFYDYLIKKYKELPNLYLEFDKIYQEIITYFKDSNKLLIIDSAAFRNLQDINLLVGDMIVFRTSINTCYERCIKRYQEKNKAASFEELASYQAKKKMIYTYYHKLNSFLNRIDKLN